MSGLGNFLNPGKLLTKDKKSSGVLPPKERTTAETSVRNQFADDEPASSSAAKRYQKLYADSSEEQSISSKARTKKPQPHYEEPEVTNPAPSRKIRNDYDEQERVQPRPNKYAMKYDEEEEDDIRPRPRRNSQRSNSDEDGGNRSIGRKAMKDPRGEARARIRQLTADLQTQHQTIKKISEEYNRRLRKTVDEQFNKFKEAIRLTVDEIMAQFEEEFKAAYEREEEATIQGIADANEHLVELQGRLDEMEEELDRSGWRNVIKSLDSEEFRASMEDAFILPKDQLSGLQLQIDEQLLNEFGEALERLMKVELGAGPILDTDGLRTVLIAFMELDFPEKTGPIGYQIGSYFCVSELGEGAFGKVYQGISVTNPNLVVALKFVSKRKIKEEKSARVRAIREKLLKSQVEIMKRCNSDHLVRCYDTYENAEYIILALEYCNAGDLYRELKKRKRIPEEEAVRILKQLIAGFAELHKHNVIHRDLKCENIFKHNEKYKIGDFGFAKTIANLYDIDMGTTLGTLTTMAPEVMSREKYGIKADLWSLGIVFYEMLFGQPPYRGLSAQSMSYAIQNHQIDLSGISKEARSLLEHVLVSDPDKRIGWTDLYKEPLLHKYTSSVILEDYQEDVDLEECERMHQTLDMKQDNGCMEKELDAFEKKQEEKYQPPLIHKMESQKIKETTTVAKATKDNEALFRGYVDRLNFERQKSVLLLEEIVQIITDERLAIKVSREVLQFVLLVSNRCLRIASPLYDALKKEKNIFNWEAYQDFLKSSWCTSFINDFSRHYESVRRRREAIEGEVLQVEQKRTVRISDFFWKLADKTSYDTHEKFLCGIEGIDFSEQDQIRYTCEKYLPKIIELMEAVKVDSPYGTSIKNRLLYFLHHYRKIAEAKYQLDKGALVHLAQSLKPK